MFNMMKEGRTMHVSDKMIYLFLVLIVVSLVGMLIDAWRLILYPYLIVVGLMILFGLWKPIKRYASKKSVFAYLGLLIYLIIFILFCLLKLIKLYASKKSVLAYLVSLIYLIMFISLDIITRDSLSGGESLIFGLTPSMALYMTIIFPAGSIVCLLYALTFQDDLT